MCTVMGGSVHHLNSMHLAMRFVEGITKARAGNNKRPFASAMPPPGVLVSFERIDDNPANPGNSDTRVLLHAAPGSLASGPLPPPTDPGVPGGQGRQANGPSYGTSAGVSALINGQSGYFPIPEPFWPEAIQAPRAPGSAPPNPQQANLPPPGPSGWQIPRRAAHPILSYSQNNSEWSVPANFPFDKYQIDGNTNVAKKLLAAAHAAQAAHEAQGGKGPSKPVCWHVFINGSYTNPKYAGFPFGILRANSARTAVNLFVFPYNFTALWKILAKLDAQMQAQRVTRAEAASSSQWKAELDEYLQHTPGYYAIPLKRAFNLYGIPHHVFPRNFGQSNGMRNIMHYSIKLHTVARREWDRLPVAGTTDPASKPPMEVAEGLQLALLDFDPAADVSHLVTNAFDVDRGHCLATLSAMRRVFVRECMASHRAYSRPNAMVPPSLISEWKSLDSAGSTMDVDDSDQAEAPASPQYTPP
ncbi:Integrator complex subunit 6, partial [Linderina pennispora]